MTQNKSVTAEQRDRLDRARQSLSDAKRFGTNWIVGITCKDLHALLAMVEQGPDVEAMRSELILAYRQGAEAVHAEWAKASDNERMLLARQSEPDFTEAAHDYADSHAALGTRL